MTTVAYTPKFELQPLPAVVAHDLADRYGVPPAAEVATCAPDLVSHERLVEASDRLRVLSFLAAIGEAPDDVRVPVDDVDAIIAFLERSIDEAHSASEEHIDSWADGRRELAEVLGQPGAISKEKVTALRDSIASARQAVLEDMAHAGACRVVRDALKEVSR